MRIPSLQQSCYNGKSLSGNINRVFQEIQTEILPGNRKLESGNVQDAAQGYYWDNSQATLHPFVAYFKKDWPHNGQVHCMCVVSDCLCYNTITVPRFLYDVLSHMKQLCSGIKKLHYFLE